MQQNYQTGDACCFTGQAGGVDPTLLTNVVIAGEVCAQGEDGDDAAEGGCALATVYFPVQVYRAGYCPAEALQKGTLFPELLSPFDRCNCVNGG